LGIFPTTRLLTKRRNIWQHKIIGVGVTNARGCFSLAITHKVPAQMPVSWAGVTVSETAVTTRLSTAHHLVVKITGVGAINVKDCSLPAILWEDAKLGGRTLWKAVGTTLCLTTQVPVRITGVGAINARGCSLPGAP